MRFKAFFAGLTAFFFFHTVSSQIVDPVKWNFTVNMLANNEAQVVATATIEEKWHVYALKVSEDPNAIGPIPTSLKLEVSSNYQTIGKVSEGKFITHFDPNFDLDLNYFEQSATFTQKIKIKAGKPFKISGEIEYMACDESKCIFPPVLNFSVNITPNADQEQTGTSQLETTGNVEIETTENVAGDAPTGIVNPATWSAGIEKISDNTFDLIFNVKLEEGWHIYSTVPNKDVEVATIFSLDTLANVKLVGGIKEGKSITAYDPNFLTELSYFEHEATFRQTVEVNGAMPVINGSADYMVCNEIGCQKGHPPKFKFDLATMQAGLAGDKATGNGDYKFRYYIPSVNVDEAYVKDCSISLTAQGKGTTLWEIFILGFLGGLLALITPCVFPMIPLTVTFFTKGSENRRKGIRNAVIFGMFVLLIYLLFSLPFHLIQSINQNIFNEISTNVTLNIFFFVTFVVFAISFFGYFEITLPSKFANKTDSKSDLGGIVGAFFMALTLAIVSFSCTGPILGSLLASSLSTDGGAMQLTAGMGGFGLALGIPFALFAMFPSWLQALPRSGGWLNSVKVVLAFLEVAAALKFFSNADLVKQWGALKYELFLGLWILLSLGIVLYLLGWIRFPHDSKIKKFSVSRIAFIGVFSVITFYMCTGFRYNEQTGTYHPLSLLSGLAPPVGYSWFFPIECPHNLDCEHDYQTALERARRENKPLFIDFTGYACVNCRRVEEHIWIDEKVLNILKEEVIVVSLHVDDRKTLPDSLQETVIQHRNKDIPRDIVTYGDRWSVLQIESFVANTQPQYIMMHPGDEMVLTTPISYGPDLTPQKYEQWLRCGLNAFAQYQQEQE
ncbi:MAG: protein-disulfide reductase DsbD family protein [Flavobacteriales bacterium]|nr:protein-disulfide reductase DsbD family protein [Flavobacteriales bacterium]